MKYLYPVVFIPEGDKYTVEVPDLPGCFTFGESLLDAVEMARDAMAMWLCDAEDNGGLIPPADYTSKINCDPNCIINYIDVDTDAYRRENDNRAIKKTLTIPNWLNSKAEKAGINFSQTLQKALKQQLGIQE